ncbi:MAG: hypothetical protein J1F36_03440 [Clostridiales bacterium]|nr:hypothetical protein [Clostridiales bacterium]
MSKKKWIIVAASILAVVAIGLGVGFGIKYIKDNNGIWFNANSYRDHTFDRRSVDYEEKIGVLELVNSLEELQELCDRYGNTAFKEGTLGYTNIIGEKVREYDEVYFSDKSLIVFETKIGNAATALSVKKIYLDDVILMVNILAQYRSGAIDLIPWTFLIEVNKADIVGVKEIKYKITKEY